MLLPPDEGRLSKDDGGPTELARPRLLMELYRSTLATPCGYEETLEDDDD